MLTNGKYKHAPLDLSAGTAAEVGKEANDTERRLLDSALESFSERGYEGASIREIIERAGVTRPVLYYYFKDKEDLFCRLMQKTYEQFNSDMDLVTSTVSGCRQRLQALMENAFRRTEETPQMVRLVLQVFFSGTQQGRIFEVTHALEEARFERMQSIMRDGLSSGELAGADAESLALAFSGVMDIYLMMKSHVPETPLDAQLAHNLVTLFMDGAASKESAQKSQTP